MRAEGGRLRAQMPLAEARAPRGRATPPPTPGSAASGAWRRPASASLRREDRSEVSKWETNRAARPQARKDAREGLRRAASARACPQSRNQRREGEAARPESDP